MKGLEDQKRYFKFFFTLQNSGKKVGFEDVCTFLFLFLRGCPGWGANPGPLDLIYFLIFHHFTAEPQRLPKTYVHTLASKTAFWGQY
jgi:hypothetical protein